MSPGRAAEDRTEGGQQKGRRGGMGWLTIKYSRNPERKRKSWLIHRRSKKKEKSKKLKTREKKS